MKTRMHSMATALRWIVSPGDICLLLCLLFELNKSDIENDETLLNLLMASLGNMEIIRKIRVSSYGKGLS